MRMNAAIKIYFVGLWLCCELQTSENENLKFTKQARYFYFAQQFEMNMISKHANDVQEVVGLAQFPESLLIVRSGFQIPVLRQ